MKKCDIIIPVWNELESTRICINKLKDHTRYPYKLIVIDNGSREPTRKYLENLKDEFHDFLLIRNDNNLGFVKAVNQGIVASVDPYILILNNDAYVTENWLTSLVETVASGPENVGLANPTSNVFGKERADGGKTEYQELDSCKGFCLLIKREVVERIGLFDEIYGMGYFEEKDFSRRAIEAGYICVRSKPSFVFHKDRLSFDKMELREELFKKNEGIYNKRWGRAINVAFIVKKENDIERRKDLIYSFLDEGDRVHLFFDKEKAIKNLKDHINIRYFPVKNALFCYAILFKLLERLKKKKIELIVAEDESILKFFNRFKFLHKARVIGGDRRFELDGDRSFHHDDTPDDETCPHRVPISVIILTKNEETRIAECIKSVLGWAGEIIVVDDRSTDKTRDIAKNLGAKVLSEEMEIEGAHRNWAYAQGRFEWILSMDADERPTEELKEEIGKIISSNPEYNAFTIPRRNFIGDYWIKAGGLYPAAQLKLFRKDKFKWEEVEVHPRAILEGVCGHLKNDLIHYTYRGWEDFLRKLNRQTTLEARKWFKLSLENPKKARYKMNVIHALWRTLDRFIRTFFIKRGYRDGFIGFMVALGSSLYQIVSFAKFRQMKR